MGIKQGDSTTVHSTGKVDFILFPEVYTKFWFEVEHNHQDLMRAMILAQVKLEDGTAIDFLNTFLGTDVKKDDPMELAYAKLLDALHMRVKNKITEKAMEKIAGQFGDHSLFPSRSDPSKPMFDDDAEKQ